MDLRPFNIVQGDGFKCLGQGLINLGADFGKVDVESILPHPTTISRKTAAVAQRVRDTFLPEVKEAVENGTCALDTDMWSDKYTKTNYLTVEAQYCTDEFELKSQTLFTVKFPPKLKKTGRNIRKLMDSELEKMGSALEDVRKNVFTTDQGSSMITALDDCYRLNCSSHLTATVPRNVFDFHKEKSKSLLSKNCPGCYSVITSCRSIVTYIKRSGKNVELAKTVKMMAEPRWNTLLNMLESVCASFLDIVELLKEQGESTRLDNWDSELATQLVNFLVPFRSVSVELQAKKSPTLHLVLIRYFDLLRHCEVDDEDHPVSNYT